MENTGKMLFRDDSPQWYVAVGKKGVGPMTTAELYEKINRGYLTWVDFGWRKGQSGWQRLCDLEDLKGLMPARPAQDLQRKVQKSAESHPVEKIDAQASARAQQNVSGGGSSRNQAPALKKPSSESRVWYLFVNSSQHGPFTQREVLRAIEIGKVTLRMHAWSHGMEGWQRLERIPGFSAAEKSSLKAASVHQDPESEVKSEKKSEKRDSIRRPMVAHVLMSDEQTVIVGLCRDISIG